MYALLAGCHNLGNSGASMLGAYVLELFDVTPAGRILNRFARDIDQIDMLLPDYFVQFLQNSCYFLSAAVMCVVANAWFAAVLVPIVVFFFGASRYFRRSIRELKRLEGISRSPIFSSFAEALDGLGTVRAFRAGPRLLRAHEARVDFHNGIFLCYWISGNWFGLRCDMVGSAISPVPSSAVRTTVTV